jgi:DNA processing protein
MIAGSAVPQGDNVIVHTPNEHPLFAYMGFDPIDINTLCQLSGLSVETLSASLLQLELDGIVAPLPGGWYQRIG